MGVYGLGSWNIIVADDIVLSRKETLPEPLGITWGDVNGGKEPPLVHVHDILLVRMKCDKVTLTGPV